MKRILFATLLSIVMSENILMENHLRPRMAWIRDKQLWDKTGKRATRDDILPEIENFSNYDDDRQQISDTRFTSEARKFPSIAVIRQPDMARFPQIDLLSSEKTKFENTNPAVLISIDIQEGRKIGDNLKEDCSAKKIYRKHNQNWQIQQPFYVEEPRWVEINSDYGDASSRRQEDDDPYILTRGKKIFRIKDLEREDGTIENFEKLFDYPSRSRRSLMKNRIRRSIDMNGKKSPNEITDKKNNQEKEKYHSLRDINMHTNNIAIKKGGFSKINRLSEEGIKKIEKKDINHGVFIKKQETDKLKDLTKRSLKEFKFTKQNQTIVDGIRTMNFIEKKHKIHREDILSDGKNNSGETTKINLDKNLNNPKDHLDADMNKRKKRSTLLKNRKFPETLAKYKTHEINLKNFEKNETDSYEQMKNKAYNDDLDYSGIHNDLFLLSQVKHKFDGKTESSNKKDIDRNKSVERSWDAHYAHGRKFENEVKARYNDDESMINKDDVGITTDLQLMREFNSDSSEVKGYSNYRDKRYVCRNVDCRIELLPDRVLKRIEKEIQDVLQRDKHSDILDRLKEGEPYVISRGKKTSHEYENKLYSMLKSRSTDDAIHPELMNLLAKNLLRKLSTQFLRCNNDNCDSNENRLSSKRSKNRQNSLDEILTTYDPFYVVRGKRADRDNFLIEMRSL